MRSLVRCRWAVVALLGFLAVGQPVTVSAAATTLPGARAGRLGLPRLRVGSQQLTKCSGSPLAYCGTLKVPLDWRERSGPDISVCYRWYPATAAGPIEGTVVPVEGGPGYPTIGSVEPFGYATMYGPVLEHFDMLAVDLRGTGCSTVLDCPTLQDYSRPTNTGSLAFAAVVGECAEALDHRWRNSNGTFVHASDLFTSAASAEDLAAVVRALRLGKVDLYGDSYGSWFAQVFAARFPSLVRSVVLDSTYPVQALDPWYRITIATMPADFDAVCSETPACAAAGGSAWQRIEALAARLRRSPISGTVPGPDDRRVHTTMGVVGLVNLVSDSAEDPGIYAALDAAARALLLDGEAAPLLRLYASRLAYDEAYFGVPVRSYSVELYMAVSCSDYPQLYPMTASAAERRADLAADIATLPAGTFAPFTTREWLAMDQNTENYTACLDWPKPTIAQPPIPSSPPFLPSRIPVLILGGSLDTWTPPAGVPEVSAELGGDERFVELANETHVVGEYDLYGCASSIIRAFVEDPAAIQQLDVSCAADVPTVRAVGSFAGSLHGVAPLQLASGSLPAPARRLAAAAVDTAGDAWCRFVSGSASGDLGLYGGRTRWTPTGAVRLYGDELVPGVKVSGTVGISGSGSSSALETRLTVRAHGLRAVTVSGSWPLYGGSARASVTAEQSGRRATGSMAAPEGIPY